MKKRICLFVLLLLLLLGIQTNPLSAQWVLQPYLTAYNLMDVKFVDRQNGWIVAGVYSKSVGVILKTTDAGSSWSVQNFPSYNLFKCTFLSPKVGWAVGKTNGGRGISLRTSDGGNTWSVQDSSRIGYNYSLYFVDSLHGWITNDDGLVIKTSNGGLGWQVVDTSGLYSVRINDVFFADTLRGWLVGEYGRIHKSTDGGMTWHFNYLTDSTKPFQPLRKIQFTTPDSGWAIGGITGMETKLRTTDGGKTWQEQRVFVGSSLHGLSFSDSRNGWTVGGVNAGLVIERTTDGGLTWVKQQFPPNRAQQSYFEAVYMINANEGWVVGDSGTVLRTTNGGLLAGAERVSDLPKNYQLFQNYPNPFNPSTTIRYELPKSANVSLKIFNTLGQVIATLVDEHKEPGYHQVQWNANVPSGIYFYRMQVGDFVETRKLVLLR